MKAGPIWWLAATVRERCSCRLVFDMWVFFLRQSIYKSIRAAILSFHTFKPKFNLTMGKLKRI